MGQIILILIFLLGNSVYGADSKSSVGKAQDGRGHVVHDGSRPSPRPVVLQPSNTTPPALPKKLVFSVENVLETYGDTEKFKEAIKDALKSENPLDEQSAVRKFINESYPKSQPTGEQLGELIAKYLAQNDLVEL